MRISDLITALERAMSESTDVNVVIQTRDGSEETFDVVAVVNSENKIIIAGR